MIIIRRTFLLWLFMFWQGGFVFYGTVVVTQGSKVLGSDFDQGLITRRVAPWLNLAGAVALGAWIADLLAERTSHRKRRWAAWLFLALTLALLFWLHPQMDALFDDERGRLAHSADFRQLHRWYLRISTAQWLGSIVFIVWTLMNWQATDRQSHPTDRAASTNDLTP